MTKLEKARKWYFNLSSAEKDRLFRRAIMQPSDEYLLEVYEDNFPEKIYTTVGVYSNNDYKINGVTEENIFYHIGYNVMMRPGRALFVDGVCYNRGLLNQDEIDEWTQKIKDNPDQFIVTKNTQPYV